ncbi:hypothetical protein TgHK011_003887 [Trichoderma gracile]|nr:hypothetical protein TgHK011_003887 [Trichoderma gracile]
MITARAVLKIGTPLDRGGSLWSSEDTATTDCSSTEETEASDEAGNEKREKRARQSSCDGPKKQKRGTRMRFRIAPHRTASRASPVLFVCLLAPEPKRAPAPLRDKTPPNNSRHPAKPSALCGSERIVARPRGTRGHASSWPMPGAHATPPRAIWSKATNEAVANARHRLAVPARPSDAVCGSCNLVGSASHPHPWLLRADWPVASAAQPITVAALLAHHRRCSAATGWAVFV